MTLAELSLRRPVTAVMFFVSLVVIGLIAAFRLPLEQFPEVNVPFLLVSLPYPGSTPQEVERTITRPAEEALATLPAIKEHELDQPRRRRRHLHPVQGLGPRHRHHRQRSARPP